MKRKERHGYLIGEPINYDGPPANDCIKNFESLIQDLCVEARINIPSDVMTRIHYYVSRFVNGFFDDLEKLRNGEDVESYASLCKARRNDLLTACTGIATNELYRLPETLFIQVSKGIEHSIPISKLHYLPSRPRRIFSYIEELGGIAEEFTITENPRIYIYLYGILFCMLQLLQQTDYETDISRVLILLPCSLGQLYEKLNPDQVIMDKYAQDLYDILSSPSSEASSDFWNLFDSVKTDIISGKLPYVKNFSLALKKHKDHLLNPKYSIRDDYVTLKATASNFRVEGKDYDEHYPSIFSSLLESDPIVGAPEVQEFDDYVGYRSRYQVSDTFDLKAGKTTVRTMTVKTVEIPNPSKYKPRGIHIGCNAIQDRCNLIHHYLQPFLNDLVNDSMIDHMKGVKFLERVTDPEYRFSQMNNVFVSDFSNATDTLSQEFQCECLSLLFADPIVNFWRFISKVPKYFFFKEDYHYYTQETGQPQGLLGSFDAFSLAHHVLMLMLMKRAGLTHMKSEDFYVILGDDSVVSYPYSETENTSYVYDIHTWLCKECNLIKNDSKTGKSFFFDEDELDESTILDFAKISVYRGKLCTPLPVSLALTYQDSKKLKRSRLTAPLWYAAHEVYFKRWMMHLIIQNYQTDWFGLIMAYTIIISGEIPYLKGFAEPELYQALDPNIRGLSIFGYVMIELKQSLLGFFISDSKRKESMLSDLSYETLWKNFIPEDKVEEMLSLTSDNKFWDLMYKYSDLADELKILYELEDESLAKYISAFVGNLSLQQSIDNLYARYKSFKTHLENDEDIFTDLYDLRYSDIFPDRKIVDLQVRSLRERQSNYTFYLLSEIKWLKEELGINSKYFKSKSSEIDFDISSSLDQIQQFAGGLYSYTVQS